MFNKAIKKNLLYGGIFLAVIALIFFFIMKPATEEKNDKIDIPIAKDSKIVTDGEYIFFNNPEGDVMFMHAFDTAGAPWGSDWNVAAAGDTHMLFEKDGSWAIFNREEKDIEETYDVKTDNAQFNDEALFYKDKKTSHIMMIDRKTKEEKAIVPYAVNEFVVSENEIVYVPEGKKTGIVIYDYKSGMVSLFAQDRTAKGINYIENQIIFSDADKKGQVFNINRSAGIETEIENVKTTNFCFSKGIYFYTEKSKGEYKLAFNNKYEHR